MKATSAKKLGFAVAVSAVLSAGAVTSANALDETRVHASGTNNVTVTYKRSELATADGRESVESRIRAAAGSVCGSADLRASGSLSVSMKRKQCLQRAVDEAMSQVGADQFASAD